MNITLKDIARMAGVSVATVSRALNSKTAGYMKPETFERIKAIMETVNYTPHALASGLRRGSAKVIGVILPTNVNPYYAQLGSFIENEAFAKGYLTLVCNSYSDIKREKDYLRHLISQKVAGILLCSTGLTGGEIDAIVSGRSRLMLLDEEVDDFGGDVVVCDDYMGGYRGAEYLRRLGHSHVLVVIGPENLISTRNRLKGFLTLMESEEGGYDPSRILKGEYTVERAYEEVGSAIRKGVVFSAVFAFNDLMAIGSIKALKEKGYRVPEDVSVLGYDNIFIDELVNPKITTVSTPLDELGKLAVERLIGPGDNDDAPGFEKRMVEPKILVRDSCARKH
jgi:DNA-binding LacI/PurR family transcriptional regulator